MLIEEKLGFGAAPSAAFAARVVLLWP